MGHPYLHFHEVRPIVHVAICHDFGRQSELGGICYTDRAPYRIRSHHLILIESGRIEGEGKGSSLVGKSGDLICFRAAEDNRYSYTSETRTLQVQLEFAPPPQHRLTPWLDGIGPLPEKVSLGNSFGEMRDVFETMCMNLPRPGASARFRLRAAVFEVLAIIAAVASPHPGALRRLDPWQRVQLRLDADLSRTISVGRLAQQFGLSANMFIRRYRSRFGMTPKAYHLHARLREAARMIHTSDKPIKEIAYALGFSDPKYFARQFQKHCSAKPSDMRRSEMAATVPPGKPTRPYSINQLIFPPSQEKHIRKWLTA